MKHSAFFPALAAALLCTASVGHATTVTFSYLNDTTPIATGSFAYATGLTGVVDYSALTAFSITVSGVSYSLTDIPTLSSFNHFGYDTAANAFVVVNNGGFQSSLSGISNDFSRGFFFNGAPGSYNEYSTNVGGTFTSISLAATAVPEPANWAMLIAGFGLVGATMRRRQLATA